MEESKISVSRNAMNYGGMTGVILFLVFMLSGILGSSFSGILQIAGYLVLALGIYVGTKKYRDQELKGFMSYGSAFYSGFLISFFAGVLIAFAIFLYLKFVDASLIDKISEQTEQNLIDAGKSDEEIEKTMEASNIFMNPTGMAIMSVLGYTIIGVIISLVTSAFLKKDNSSPGDAFDNFIQENQ